MKPATLIALVFAVTYWLSPWIPWLLELVGSLLVAWVIIEIIKSVYAHFTTPKPEAEEE